MGGGHLEDGGFFLEGGEGLLVVGGADPAGSNFLDDFRADALVAAWLAEHLAAEFQDNSFVADLG